MNLQITLLNNGDLQVRVPEATTLESLIEQMEISKEKKKHLQILKGSNVITNPETEILPADRITLHLDDSFNMNDETPMFLELYRLFMKMTGAWLPTKTILTGSWRWKSG